MDKQQIINEIEQIVGTYSDWYIGITDDANRRKNEHGNPSNWHDWNANNETESRAIEKHFLDKGMSGDTGGGDNPTYVYIYKK